MTQSNRSTTAIATLSLVVAVLALTLQWLQRRDNLRGEQVVAALRLTTQAQRVLNYNELGTAGGDSKHSFELATLAIIDFPSQLAGDDAIRLSLEELRRPWRNGEREIVWPIAPNQSEKPKEREAFIAALRHNVARLTEAVAAFAIR